MGIVFLIALGEVWPSSIVQKMLLSAVLDSSPTVHLEKKHPNLALSKKGEMKLINSIREL